MQKINRSIIHTISRYSNWSVERVEGQLHENVYATAVQWRQFFNLFLLGLGVVFSLAGILFFFAFNWADMSKGVKFGLIQGLIVACIVPTVFISKNKLLHKLLLTAGSVLVGVLFSVFGQIYQTGANAYDLFLVWTLAILIWVLVSNFAPLWLIFLLLCNGTFVLYAEQIANDWEYPFILNCLFLGNALAIILLETLHKRGIIAQRSAWFINLVAIAAILYMTQNINLQIFDSKRQILAITLAIGGLFYALGFTEGLKSKNVFYIGGIGFSVTVMIAAFLIKIIEDETLSFLIVSMFMIAMTTLLIRQIIQLNKKWAAEALPVDKTLSSNAQNEL